MAKTRRIWLRYVYRREDELIRIGLLSDRLLFYTTFMTGKPKRRNLAANSKEYCPWPDPSSSLGMTAARIGARCWLSFPLDCCRGFAGDVVDDAVDAADFVYYAVGYYG